MFIISLTYKKPLDEVDKHIPAHTIFLDEGFKLGYFLASGRKDPRTGGIILSNYPNRIALEIYIKSDPFYIHEIADYEIIEFIPTKFTKKFKSFVS
ncbi:MAG: GTP cyclohydrolase [Gammaproteobacteria bacterium]|nr:GTP cyclohydrolase [Gammaproteobacteria bacterium]